MKIINIRRMVIISGIFSLLIGHGLSHSTEQSKEQDIKRERAYQSRKNTESSRNMTPIHQGKKALPIDSDNDGMPDDWEDDHGLDKNNPEDAWWDEDEDKVINLFEYQLDSDPANPATPPFVTVTSAGALETALDNVADGTNIKVAGGTYLINYSTHSEKVVMIQGGWSSDFSQRDLSKYPTILDGQLQDEILYFSYYSDQPVVILDGLHFIRGSGTFGAVNLLASGTTIMKTSVFNCSFSESTASEHGGVLKMNNWNSSESDRTIANTLIAGNLASGINAHITGGTQARWRIINTTITDNENGGGDNGFGIEAFTLNTGVLDIQIYNSIIWGNEQNDIEIRRNITCDADYSDIGNVNADFGAVYYPGPNNINTNPLFVIGDNYHLAVGSPCIDTGTNTVAPVNDLEGKLRPNPDTGKTDMGCYEFTFAHLDSGDYDGDGRSDIAIFRAGSGLWAIRGITRVYFGGVYDRPVCGDYDGNGTTDIAIFREASGLWGIKDITRTYFGSSSDLPVAADYDGDGSCDIGLFRESTGLWAIRDLTRMYFGSWDDRVIPGDYDGDGTKDIGLFRGSSKMWALRNVTRIYFGEATDSIVPGDYNGDGTWEAGIFRSSSGLWAIRGITRIYFGSTQDQTVPADYDGDSMDDLGIFRENSGLWAIREITRAYFGSAGDIPVTR